MMVRIYTGTDGQSNFEGITGPWTLDGRGREQTPWQHVTQLRFRRNSAGYFNDWHTGARRLYAIILAGQGECAIGDRTVRRWEPGDVMWEEDLTGQGHTPVSGVHNPQGIYAGSSQPLLKPLSAMSLDAEILEVYHPCLGYDVENSPITRSNVR